MSPWSWPKTLNHDDNNPVDRLDMQRKEKKMFPDLSGISVTKIATQAKEPIFGKTM